MTLSHTTPATFIIIRAINSAVVFYASFDSSKLKDQKIRFIVLPLFATLDDYSDDEYAMKEKKEKKEKKKRKSSTRREEEENGDKKKTKTKSATRLESKSTTNLNDIDAEIERVLSRLKNEKESENDSSDSESSSSSSSSSSLGRIAPLPPEAYPEHYGYGSKKATNLRLKGNEKEKR